MRSSRPTRSRSTTNAVDGPARGLPRVVRGAGAERRLVPDDARVAADLLRALRVPEKVRVVALLPHEDEVRGGHEVGDERAVLRGARERVGADAEPTGVVVAAFVRP